MARTRYIVMVVDTITNPWPTGKKLVKQGWTVGQAERYLRIRRSFTSDLKRRLKEARN